VKLLKVAKVSAAVTFPLRQKILRPHESLADMVRPDDEHPDSAHFAVFDIAGEVIATGTVRGRPAAWAADEAGYQIRGMAVDENFRGRGLGAALLDAIIGHVQERGGGILWAEVRVKARTLYERAGFVSQGEPFKTEHAGLQVVMWVRISS
jgi:ribosomal protein S18 acetylase RimI-like enzyme